MAGRAGRIGAPRNIDVLHTRAAQGEETIDDVRCKYKFDTEREEGDMPKKELVDKLSIYVPKSKAGQQPVERLMKIGEKKDRSINYLVVEAILQYLDKEERKQ